MLNFLVGVPTLKMIWNWVNVFINVSTAGPGRKFCSRNHLKNMTGLYLNVSTVNTIGWDIEKIYYSNILSGSLFVRIFTPVFLQQGRNKLGPQSSLVTFNKTNILNRLSNKPLSHIIYSYSLLDYLVSGILKPQSVWSQF